MANAMRSMVIGGKETFLIRVLVKKMTDAGMDVQFVPADINAINGAWEGKAFVTCYLESGERLPEEVLPFLVDKLTDSEKQMLLIGDQSDLQYMYDHVPGALIYKSFVRPLNNEDYIKAAGELSAKVASGEFRKSILIVDDDPTYLSLVREWLKGTYKVAMAASGLQAIKWLGKNKADLILLDHEMPVTSGPQVLEMLRSDAETKTIPVIFLTGKSDKESVMAVVALKPEGYLLKNITREELLQKLEEFFAGRNFSNK